MTIIAADVVTDQSDPTGGSRGFETRLDLVETQAVGKPFRYLEGRAVPYGTYASLGLFMEQHSPGSLRQSTTAGKGRALPLLLFHDARSFPIGVADSWHHSDDDLRGVWKLNDSPEAQRAATAAEAGELTGLSIGFQPIRSRWEYVAWDSWDPELGPDHMDKVTREESRLVEVSVVPTPAFADAQVTAVRGLGVRGTHAWTRDDHLLLRSSTLGEPPQAETERWRDIVEGLRSP